MIFSSQYARLCAGLVLLCSAAATAAPPAAPQVTVGADLKQFRFDWDYVPQANRYELWFRANAGAAWAKFGETPSYRPRITTGVSAHLLDWDQARYQVRACNPSGCTPSPELGVAGHLFDSLGYFKASSLHNKARFGLVTAISEDGNTLAAFSAEETAPRYPGNALYIFRKIDGQWRQEERMTIFTDTSHPIGGGYDNLGLDGEYEASLSLSADGNVLTATFPLHAGSYRAGILSIFRREAGRWIERVQYINGETTPGSLGRFSAEVNHAGTRILYRPGQNQPVILLEAGFSPWDWNVRTIFNPRSDLASGYGCPQVRLSGDGNSIVWACSRLVVFDEKHLFIDRLDDPQLGASFPLTLPRGHFIGNLAVDYAGRTIALSSVHGTSDSVDSRNHVQIFRAPDTPGAAWAPPVTLLPGEWNGAAVSNFGASLSLSRDGALLAVLDPRDTGAGMGVLSPPLQAGTAATGATYVYELRAAGPRLRRVLKPNNAVPAAGLQGGVAAFAQNGKTLAVSEPDEPGNSPGIDGDRDAAGRDRTGAIWLY